MLRPFLCNCQIVNADKRYLPTESFYSLPPRQDCSVILYLIVAKIDIIY